MALEDVEVVESTGRGAEVPIADNGGLAAGLLQEFREGLLVTVELFAVGHEAILVV